MWRVWDSPRDPDGVIPSGIICTTVISPVHNTIHRVAKDFQILTYSDATGMLQREEKK
jgi:hypothetical protein